MSLAILNKLVALLLTVAMGYVGGRLRWFGHEAATQVFSAAALYLFIPALLFRTTSRIALAELPLGVLGAYFVPALAVLLGVYVQQRRARERSGPEVAVPAVRALAATFGNTVQMGIPVALALYGEAGLGLHLTIVSIHALVLLSITTLLAERDLARERMRADPGISRWSVLASMLRSTLIHPVVLPVLAGLLFNATGLALPGFVDETLALLGLAVVPLCLVLIGLSLADYGLAGRTRPALALALVKLVLLPAAVLCVAYAGFGLRGVPLSVLVMAAALPVGANPLIFAQRYRTLEAETVAAIVVSTLGFALTAPLWLVLLQHL